MLIWLNGTPGVQYAPQKTAVDIMIESYKNNQIVVRDFLDQDEFYVQLKNLNHNLLEFVFQERKKICKDFIAVIIDKCEEIQDDNNYKQYITYPNAVLNIMALDVPPIMNAFFEETVGEELLTQLFSILDQDYELPEPQLANFMRFLNPIMQRNLNRICQYAYSHLNLQPPIIQKCLNHLYSSQITGLLVILFNPESSNRLMEQDRIHATKVEMIKICMRNFDALSGPEVLNFMLLIHEIMTRFVSNDKSNDVMNYLISYDVIQQLFNTLKKNDNLYTSKSAAHILSLISNYYSYSLQNITIFEDGSQPQNNQMDYHMQLSQQFESSDFYRAATQNMSIFPEILQRIQKGKIGVLTFKLIEITDNLIRISNISLWKQMSQLHFLQNIFRVYFEFPNTNIIHKITEKMITYILNRTISDFHPFWAHQLFVQVNILQLLSDYIINHRADGHIIGLIDYIQSFQKDIKDMNTGHFAVQIGEIQNVFQNRAWIHCISASKAASQVESDNQKNEAQMSAKEINFDEASSNDLLSKQNIFQSAKDNFVEGSSMRTQGDDILMDEDEDYVDQDEETKVVDVKGKSLDLKGISKPLRAEDKQDEAHHQFNQTQISTNLTIEIVGAPITIITSESNDDKMLSYPKPDLKQDKGYLILGIQYDPLPPQDIKFNNAIIVVPMVQQSAVVEDYEDSSQPLRKSSQDEEEKVPLLEEKEEEIHIKLDQSLQPMNDKPLLVQQHPLDQNSTRIDLMRQGSFDSPSPTFVNSCDESPDYDRSLSLKKRSSAMESSLKFKSMGEDPSFEFQIVSTMSESQNKILVQPGNHRVLKVDELDEAHKEEFDLVQDIELDTLNKDQLDLLKKEKLEIVKKDLLDIVEEEQLEKVSKIKVDTENKGDLDSDEINDEQPDMTKKDKHKIAQEANIKAVDCQSFDLSMSQCSIDSGSKRVKVLFRQSLNKKPSLTVSKESPLIESMWEMQRSNSNLSSSMLSSINSNEIRSRKISQKDINFLNFLKQIKDPISVNQEIQ